MHGNQEYWNRLLLTELPIPKEGIKECAEAAATLDRKMESIQKKIPVRNEDEE